MSDYISWLDNYIQNPFPKIEGWVDPRIFDVLKLIYSIQKKINVFGGGLEIGVHHGKFFIPINGMVDSPEYVSFAIDLFSEQELNIDSSGLGDLEKFQENLKLYDRYQGQNVEIIQSDSTRLNPQLLLKIQIMRPKVISIDGGHTPEHTINDLKIASQVIHPKGVIFLDDILNPYWIGVFEGIVRYLLTRPTLWPVFMGYNKLLLTPMSVHYIYLREFQKYFTQAKNVNLCGYNLISVHG